MKKIIGAMILCFVATNAFAWATKGHRIVGEIATKHLSSKSAKVVRQLLDGRELAMVGNYPDFLKSDKSYRKYNPWHYVNMGPGENYYDSKKNPKGDLIKGLIHFENILRDKKSSKKDRIFALKYIVHMVADIHQPFHTGYARDRGGNDEPVTWFEQEKNLHWLWDEGLVEMQNLSYTEYVSFIHFPTRKQLKAWPDTSFVDWAHESRKIMEGAYANLNSGKYWEYRYNYKYRDIMNERLLKGGVRLASLLNSIFERKPIPAKMLQMRKKIGKK